MKKLMFLILVALFLVTSSASAELKLWYQMDSADDFNLGQNIGGFSGRVYVTNAANGFKASGMTSGANVYFDATEGALRMESVSAWSVRLEGMEPISNLFTSTTQYSFSLWAKGDMAQVTGSGYAFYVKNSSGYVFKGDLSFKPSIPAMPPAPKVDRGAIFTAPGGSWEQNAYGIWNPENTAIYVDPTEWNMYTYTWDADNNMIRTYVNGTLRGSYAGPGGDVPAITGAITEWGFGSNEGGNHLPGGWYKDFRIYDTALDASEVLSLFNPSDINGDKSVDLDDLAIMVEDWLAEEGIVETDLNWDGIVNFKDYAIWANNLFDGGQYYFDSVGGNDNNLGTLPDQAWQSLSKFNSMTFLPGEKIFFKAGSQWTGNIQLKGSGNAQAPIVIDAYGDISDQNNKPRIDNTNTWGGTLTAINVEWWEVNNLQLTHHPAERTRWISAVDIKSDEFGKMDHIHIKDCYIHDVYGMLEVFGGGTGISLGSSQDGPIESWLNDILIEGCYFETTDNSGIRGGSNPADGDRQPATNVVVRGNFFTDMGESAITMLGTDGALVEYNVITQSFGRGSGGCGIWPFASNNTIIQYNEVYDCIANGDGEAYDSDYQCEGTIIQYNYSHDNPGGFLRICNSGNPGEYNRNNIIRYNISVNDGTPSNPVIELWKNVENSLIYNNIIYLDSTMGTVNMVNSNRYGGGNGGSHYWWNNIWVAEPGSKGRFAIDDGSSNSWSNNCFYGSFDVGQVNWLKNWTYSSGMPTGPKVIGDPKFVNPGDHSIGSSLTGYQLQSTSPCIGAGLNISNNGGYDFWGNVLYNSSPDIGAHER